MFSTMLYGMRVSIIIGFGAVALQALIWVSSSASWPGTPGAAGIHLMRVADVQLSFSTYMVAIFVGRHLPGGLRHGPVRGLAVPLLIIVIGLAEWPQYARTVRASVLAEKKKEYVEAARVIGVSTPTDHVAAHPAQLP